MDKPQRIYRIFLATLWTLVTASTSVLSESEDKLIFMFADQFVALAPQDSVNATPNHQPVIVSVFSLSKILSSVLVKLPNKSRDNNRLFGDSEILILSQTLSSALAKANPEQDILFKTQSGQGSSANLAVKKGRVFWRDSKLHVLFAEIQDAKKSSSTNDRRQDSGENTQFGSRIVRSDKVDFVFVTTHVVAKEKDLSGATRSDWISIDTNQLLGYTINQNSATIKHDGEKLADSDRLATTKEKLEKLKFLRQKGMLSEKDYQKKVRELLDEVY